MNNPRPIEQRIVVMTLVLKHHGSNVRSSFVLPDLIVKVLKWINHKTIPLIDDIGIKTPRIECEEFFCVA